MKARKVREYLSTSLGVLSELAGDVGAIRDLLRDRQALPKRSLCSVTAHLTGQMAGRELDLIVIGGAVEWLSPGESGSFRHYMRDAAAGTLSIEADGCAIDRVSIGTQGLGPELGSVHRFTVGPVKLPPGVLLQIDFSLPELAKGAW